MTAVQPYKVTNFHKMEMRTKDISVEGNLAFPCPIDWNVKDATIGIRDSYGLEFGDIRMNGVPLLQTVVIRDTTGELSFVGGRPIQKGISC